MLNAEVYLSRLPWLPYHTLPWQCANRETNARHSRIPAMSSKLLEQAKEQALLLCSACELPPRRSPNGSIIPLRKCTRCLIAAYHDKECQKRHYPEHKAHCRRYRYADGNEQVESATCHYRVENRPGRGNCLVSTKFIPANQPIDTSQGFSPIIPPVLFENQRLCRCALCFAPTTEDNTLWYRDERYPVQVCPECLCHSPYVNSLLKDEVRAIAKCRSIPKILGTAIAVFRICWAIQMQQLTWDAIACMISHSTTDQHNNLSGNAAVHQQAIVLTVTSLSHVLHASVEISRIQAILERMKVNAFTITTSNGESLGIGLFQTAHYMNHSCRPNITQSFTIGRPGKLPQLNLQSKVAIPANEEMTISYIDSIGQNRKERQAELKKSYHFDCQCALCQEET